MNTDTKTLAALDNDQLAAEYLLARRVVKESDAPSMRDLGYLNAIYKAIFARGGWIRVWADDTSEAVFPAPEAPGL